ncbi:MAG: hypothetical protein DCF24_06545 [Cyanobium sp.]|nr:MAG: hypothetical protein DCF24_06545 [Cyanobium sp.]
MDLQHGLLIISAWERLQQRTGWRSAGQPFRLVRILATGKAFPEHLAIDGRNRQQPHPGGPRRQRPQSKRFQAHHQGPRIGTLSFQESDSAGLARSEPAV